jgi:hypothetical protein
VYWYTVNDVSEEVTISIFKVIQKGSVSQKRGYQHCVMGGGYVGHAWKLRGVMRIVCTSTHSPIRPPNLSVAEHFWNIRLLGRAISDLSYERFITISYKFKLPTYIQETLVTGRRGYLQRDLNEKTVSSR